jgi:hypothetical protein
MLVLSYAVYSRRDVVRALESQSLRITQEVDAEKA